MEDNLSKRYELTKIVFDREINRWQSRLKSSSKRTWKRTIAKLFLNYLLNIRDEIYYSIISERDSI